jgi:hypothetical protein
MKDLRELFIQRDKTHLEKTNEIATEIQHVFHGILEYMEESKENVEWTGLVFEKDDNILIFNARINKIDEMNVISVGIPLDVVLKQSKEEIVGFLIQANREEREKHEAAEDEARQKFTSRVKQMIEEEEGGVLMVPVNKPQTPGDADEEQTGADVLRELEKHKRTLH